MVICGSVSPRLIKIRSFRRSSLHASVTRLRVWRQIVHPWACNISCDQQPSEDRGCTQARSDQGEECKVWAAVWHFQAPDNPAQGRRSPSRLCQAVSSDNNCRANAPCPSLDRAACWRLQQRSPQDHGSDGEIDHQPRDVDQGRDVSCRSAGRTEPNPLQDEREH
jgi:hypothetical protein